MISKYFYRCKNKEKWYQNMSTDVKIKKIDTKTKNLSQK